MSANRDYDGRVLKHPAEESWHRTAERWAAKPSSTDPLTKGEIRWGAQVNAEVFVGDGKSGILIPQTAVPVSIGRAATMLQTPNYPGRVWEVTLGLYWQNPTEGRQGPGNGMTLHASFRLNWGIGSMQQVTILDSGPGIDAAADVIATTAPYSDTGLILRTFDPLINLTTGQPTSPALEQGSCFISSSAFTIEGYLWAENLPGAAFGTADHTLHAKIFAAVSPYTRGART